MTERPGKAVEATARYGLRSFAPDPSTVYRYVPDPSALRPTAPPTEVDPSRPQTPLRPVLYPTLRDAWPGARPFTLGGWFERNGFTPGWTALLIAVTAFLLYQIVGGVITAVGAVAGLMGGTEAPTVDEVMQALGENAGLLLGGNAVGQAVGFGLLVLLVTRGHTRAVGPFLRLKRPDLAGLGLAVLGWVVLYPGLLWVGSINQFLPQPQWLQDMERMQNDLIESALLHSDLGGPFLLLTMALTPAVCEELLFRGYLQRQTERSLGVVWSIVGVGLAFGLYHLRLTQFVPLALLGTYLGYVTWATGSLGTAMLVHFLNNGFAVLAAVYARSSETLDLDAVEAMTVPWYLGTVSLAAAVGVGVLLHRRREAVVGATPDAQPVSSAPAFLPDS